MADWKTNRPECDTLQHWTQQVFPASDKFLFAPPSDSMPGVIFYWATFEEEYNSGKDGLDGFTTKNTIGKPVYYIVIRRNWDNPENST